MEKKHRHHIQPRHLTGTDDEWNLTDIGFIEHAELHANRFLDGLDEFFDFRHEGWRFLDENLKLKVREKWSKKFSEINPMKNPNVAEKVAAQRRGKPGASKGSKWSEESKLKITGEGNHNFGGGYTLNLSTEQRQAISERMVNDNPMKKPEIAAKVAAAHKGRVSPRKGVVLSDETKQKLREASTGRKHTEEAKAKMTASKTGKKRGPYKK